MPNKYTALETNISSLERAKFKESIDSSETVVNVRTLSKLSDSDGNEASIVDGKLKVQQDKDMVDGNNPRSTIGTYRTIVNAGAALITTPDDSKEFTIYHKTENAIVYIGDSSLTASPNFLELENGDILEVNNMQKDNDNEIYAITASGTVALYVAGALEQRVQT